MKTQLFAAFMEQLFLPIPMEKLLYAYLQEYPGPNCSAIPEIFAEGNILASAADIMDGILAGWLLPTSGHYSGDGIIYRDDGQMKLVHDAWRHLPAIQKEIREKKSVFATASYKGATVYKGAVAITPNEWEAIDGIVVSREEMNAPPQENPAWHFLAEDPKRLKQYQAFLRQETGGSPIMPVHLFPDERGHCLLRLWRLDGIGNGMTGAAAGDTSFINYDGMNLVALSKRPKELLYASNDTK